MVDNILTTTPKSVFYNSKDYVCAGMVKDYYYYPIVILKEL